MGYGQSMLCVSFIGSEYHNMNLVSFYQPSFTGGQFNIWSDIFSERERFAYMNEMVLTKTVGSQRQGAAINIHN